MNRHSLWILSLVAVIALPLWGPLSRIVVELISPGAGELTVYLTSKGLFAFALLLALSKWGGLRRYGFERGATGWFLLPGAPFLLLTALVLMNPEAPFGLGLAATLGWILAAVLISVGEEGVFRGLLWRALEEHGPLTTSLVTSLLFGAMHLVGLFTTIPWPVVLAQVVFAAGVGMMLAAVRLVSRSLLGPILLHALFDAGALVAAGGITELLSDSISVGRLLVPGIVFFSWGLGCVLVIRRRRARSGTATAARQAM